MRRRRALPSLKGGQGGRFSGSELGKHWKVPKRLSHHIPSAVHAGGWKTILPRNIQKYACVFQNKKTNCPLYFSWQNFNPLIDVSFSIRIFYHLLNSFDVLKYLNIQCIVIPALLGESPWNPSAPTAGKPAHYVTRRLSKEPSPAAFPPGVVSLPYSVTNPECVAMDIWKFNEYLKPLNTH